MNGKQDSVVLVGPKEYSDIQRALGIIEGVSFGSEERIALALTTAIEIIDEALEGGK